MDIKLSRLFLCFVSIFILSSNTALAHPGRTASDGCHYCRTRCDYWGVAWNERHCHGGGVSAPVEEPVIIKQVAPTRIPPTRIPPTRRPTLVPTQKPTSITLPASTQILESTTTPSVTPSIVSFSQVKGVTKTAPRQNMVFAFLNWLFSK